MRILFLVVLILAGCGSHGYRKGMESFANKDYAAAHDHFINCVNEIQLTECMVNAGASAYNMGHTDEAIRWYTLAARHGDQDAISRLTVLGLPVPAAGSAQPDLLRSLGQGLGIAGGALAAQPTPQPRPPINCTSRRTAWGTVETDCQ